jgi:DNA repair protein RadC
MKSSLLIKDWSSADQPREKLVEKGPSALSDAELIAILLGTGTKTGNALDLARHILQLVNNDLNSLGALAWSDITKIHGVGKAKALVIKAAMELGRRRKDTASRENSKITSSRDAYVLFQSELIDLPNEEFWVAYLNRASRVLRKKRISEGGVSGTVADPKIIFKTALNELASSIIVAHNHPSGSVSPSQADIELTRKLVAAGKLLDIQVIDHIIVAGRNYCSFADSGLL